MDNFGTVHETRIFGTSAEPHLAFLQPGMRLDVAGSQYFHVAISISIVDQPGLFCLGFCVCKHIDELLIVLAPLADSHIEWMLAWISQRLWAFQCTVIDWRYWQDDMMLPTSSILSQMDCKYWRRSNHIKKSMKMYKVIFCQRLDVSASSKLPLELESRSWMAPHLSVWSLQLRFRGSHQQDLP